MAIEWKLTLKDGVSAPANKGAEALGKLQKALGEVRKEEERVQRLERAIANDNSGASRWMKYRQAMEGVLQSQRAVGAKSWSQMKKIAGGIGLVAGATAAAAIQIGSEVATIGIEGGVWFAKSVADAQKFKASTMFAFEQILKSKTEAQAIFDKTTRTALYLGSDFRTTMSSINSLLAQGFKADFADQIIRAMADLKTVNPQANLEGIVRAISQIKTTGRLQGDELMQLAEAGVNVEAVYRKIGIAMNLKGNDIPAQVQKLQKAGKISADVAIQGVMSSIQDQTGGKEFGALSNARSMQGFDGAIARAMTLKDAMLANVNIDWSPINRGIEKVMAAMSSPAGERFLAAMGDGISKILGRLDKITPEQLEKALDKGTDAAIAFADAVGAVLDMAIALGPVLGAVADIGVFLTNQFTLWLSGLTNLLGPLNSIADWIQNIDLSSAASDLGASIIAGIIAGITGGAGGVMSALEGVASGAIEATKRALGINSPSREFDNLYQMVNAGAIRGLELTAPRVVAANENTALESIRAVQNITTVTPAAVGTAAGQRIATVTNIGGASSAQSNVYNIGGISIREAKDAKQTAKQVTSELESLRQANG